jgi:hypothetical protein
MVHVTKRLELLLLLLLATALTACDAAKDSSLNGPEVGVELSRVPDGWHAVNKDALKTLQKLEKERIKLEKERRREERKALKAQFDEYKKSGMLPKTRIGAELLVCEPQDYDADAEIIGPDGGEIRVGGHKLTIPAGALEDYTLITMEAPPSLLVEVEFTPHGIYFDKEPLLKLSYKRCWVPHNQPFRVVYIDDLARILEWPTSFDLKHWGDVYARIGHFSRYAVASN